MASQTSVDSKTIKKMFSSISERYDLANSVLSFGVHHRWRKALVEWSGAHGGDRVLDCATGTGDLAIEFMKTVGSSGEVIGIDFCEEMIALAPEKAKKKISKKVPRFDFKTADVLNLPFEDKTFDIVSIAFGIRNVEDPVKALREMARVTKSGGIMMILEFGQTNLPLFEPLYEFYTKHLLPRFGGWVTGKKEAYKYLQKSSQSFPCREEFLGLMHTSRQFEQEEYQGLTGGIVYLYKARKLTEL